MSFAIIGTIAGVAVAGTTVAGGVKSLTSNPQQQQQIQTTPQQLNSYENKITSLQKQLTTEQAKKSPNQNTINSLTQQIGNYQLVLGQETSQLSGTGGTVNPTLASALGNLGVITANAAPSATAATTTTANAPVYSSTASSSITSILRYAFIGGAILLIWFVFKHKK